MRHKRTRLARTRKNAGLTQEELAYRLGVDRSTVGRWEGGDTEPSPWMRPKLAKLLGLSREQLALLLTEPSPAAEGEDSVLFSLGASRGRNRADSAAVAQLARQVAALADEYEAQPSASLLAPAGRCHAAVTSLLSQSGNERVCRDLHAVATDSAVLMSQLIWDASQRRDSCGTLTYCAEAIAHADAAGNVVATAKAELRKAYVSLYGVAEARDPRAGLATAQHAAHQSRPVSQALHGVALLHVGEAFGMLGEYRQCERALSDAETAFDRMNADDAGADCFSPTQFGRLAGSCYLSLGTPERAEAFLTDIAAQLHDRPKSRSLVLGNLALAYLRQRQRDAAVATLHEATDLLEQCRGGGGMTVVFGAARELYPWRREPGVQDVQDRLLALIA